MKNERDVMVKSQKVIERVNWLARFIYFRVLGWTINSHSQGLPEKCVIIIVPHTSWHDFYIGALVRRIMKLKINYIAKKELFNAPFGWYFRWMGGFPLDRTPGQRKVEAIAEILKKRKHLRLAMAPEGTRKKVLKWKTGFYFIAKLGGAPIVMVAFDYGKKEVKISKPFIPTNNKESDFDFMKSFYSGVTGKVPAYT